MPKRRLPILVIVLGAVLCLLALSSRRLRVDQEPAPATSSAASTPGAASAEPLAEPRPAVAGPAREELATEPTTQPIHPRIPIEEQGTRFTDRNSKRGGK